MSESGATVDEMPLAAVSVFSCVTGDLLAAGDVTASVQKGYCDGVADEGGLRCGTAGSLEAGGAKVSTSGECRNRYAEVGVAHRESASVFSRGRWREMIDRGRVVLYFWRLRSRPTRARECHCDYSVSTSD